MNGKRSNYDQLFITGRRCFYVDPCKDHRIDYFYSWKSFFSGFLGSVYVWCRDQLLYSYQKFIIFLLVALLLSFPVYAEDERYEFQNIQNEALYLQGYDLNDYYNNLEYQNNSKLLSSINEPYNTLSSEYQFLLLDYVARINSSDQIEGRFNFNGNIPISARYNRSINGSSYLWVNASDIGENYILAPSAATSNPFYINGLSLKFDDNDDYINYDTGLIVIDKNNLTSEYSTIIQFIGGKMTAYLEQVATVFTWILTHITELITFILGNPFLAVSLVLFMCGAVISFYVRIKNS